MACFNFLIKEDILRVACYRNTDDFIDIIKNEFLSSTNTYCISDKKLKVRMKGVKFINSEEIINRFWNSVIFYKEKEASVIINCSLSFFMKNATVFLLSKERVKKLLITVSIDTWLNLVKSNNTNVLNLRNKKLLEKYK